MACPRSEVRLALALALALTCAACDRKESSGGGGGEGDPALAVPPPPAAPPLPELEPGQMPLGFDAAPLDAAPDTRVLFVRRGALRESLGDTSGVPALRWVSGTLDEVSGEDAVVRARRADGSYADAERVPAGVVIPMAADEVAPGDLVLTNLDRGPARRAWVVAGGGASSPSVRLLDDDLESGPVPDPVPLAAGTFRRVGGDLDLGAWVASPLDGALVPGMIVARAGDALLLRGFGGALRTASVDRVRPTSRELPAPGQAVLAPYLGRYLPAEVTAADASTGQVTVSLSFQGDGVRSTHGVGTLLTP